MTVLVTYRSELEAAPLKNQILDVYSGAFAPPPYNRNRGDVIAFETSFIRHIRRQGFRMVTAWEEGRLIGFSYGYTSAAGQWWHDLVEEALSPEQANTWLTDCFELVELALDPAYQGRKIGSALHDGLLEGRPHSTAVLSTLQAETTALNLYRKRGWVDLLQNYLFPNVPEPFRIMGLDLKEKNKLFELAGAIH